MVSHYWPADLAPQDSRLFAARVVSLALPSCESVDIFCWVTPESSGRRRRPANSKWSIQSNLRSENTARCELLESRKLLADAWLFFSQHISRGSRFRRVNKSESASLSSLSQKCPNSSWRNDETCPFLWKNAPVSPLWCKKYSVLNERVPPNMKLNLTVANLPKGSVLCKKSPKTFVPSFCSTFFESID